MKRKLMIAAAILIVLLLSIWGFVQYRQYSSYKIPIHANAENIIKINTDEIIETFIKEYGFGFNKKIKKATGQDTGSHMNSGIYLPGNIFIYQINNRAANSWFTCLPIHDEKDFKNYLHHEYKFLIKDSAGISYGASPDKIFSFAGNKEFAVFGFSPEKENLHDNLIEILLGNHILSKEDGLVKKLKASSAAIYFFGKEINGSLSFKDKTMEITANLNVLNQNNIPQNPIEFAAAENGFISLALNFNFPVGLFKNEYRVKDFTINTDSLLFYYKGFVGLKAGESFTSTDTTISYEYDENFEMKEIKTINKVAIPKINLMIKADSGIIIYLKNQSIITAENKLNKNIFPLYPVNVSYKNQFLILSTEEQFFPTSSPEPSKNFLNLLVNFAKKDTGFLSKILHPYIENLESIELYGASQKEMPASITGKIQFKKPAVQAILGLIGKF